VAIVVVLAAVCLAHGRSLGGEFLFDDIRFIRDNPRLAELDTPWRFFTDPGIADPSNTPDIYRPLRTLMFAVERVVFGASPAAFHAMSLLLHGANALLVLGLLRVLGAGVAASVTGACLFAVHPAQVEAVAWISSRADLLGGFFVLLGLHAWLRSRGPDRWYAATCVAGLLAALSREASVVFPLLLMVVDVLRPAGNGIREPVQRWSRYLLPLAISATYALAAKALLEDARGLPLGHLLGWWGDSYGANLATAARAALYQVLFALFPLRPSVDWYVLPSRGLWEPAAWVAGALLLAAAVASFRWVRRPGAARWVGGGFLFAAAAAFLTSHVLFPVGIPTAERFLYLPLVGLAMALVPLWDTLGTAAPRLRCVLVATALAALTTLSAHRNAVWHGEEILWSRGPSGAYSPRAERSSLGAVASGALRLLVESDEKERAGDAAAAVTLREEALASLDAAAPRVAVLAAFWVRHIGVIDSHPRTPLAARIQRARAAVLSSLGRHDEAVAAASRARALAPELPVNVFTDAVTLFRAGHRVRAGWAMEEALRLGVDAPGVDAADASVVLNGVAEERLARGLIGAALRALRRSASLQPDAGRNGAVARIPELEALVASARGPVETAFRASPKDAAAAMAAVVFRGVVEGDVEGARRLFLASFKDSADGPGLRNLWAMATMEADDTEAGTRAALDYHGQTLQRHPGDPGARLGQARCQASLGETAAARATLEELQKEALSEDVRREVESLMGRLPRD
jgi:tetratricopeptide (TPR) repeat protein